VDIYGTDTGVRRFDRIMTLPFGMLFEENEFALSESLTQPDYDPIEGLSFITTSTGQRLPYVIWAEVIGETRTGMATKASIDPTDKDYHSNSV